MWKGLYYLLKTTLGKILIIYNLILIPSYKFMLLLFDTAEDKELKNSKLGMSYTKTGQILSMVWHL
jgi:hypothetical protein